MSLQASTPDLLLRSMLGVDHGTHRLLLRYSQKLTVQAALTAAANAHYALPERLGPWLLMRHGRVDGGEIELTCEIMAPPPTAGIAR